MKTKELSVTSDEIVHDQIVTEEPVIDEPVLETIPEPVLTDPAPEPESVPDEVESKPEMQNVEVEIVQDEPEPVFEEVVKTIIPGLVEEDLSAGDVAPEIFNNKVLKTKSKLQIEIRNSD